MGIATAIPIWRWMKITWSYQIQKWNILNKSLDPTYFDGLYPRIQELREHYNYNSATIWRKNENTWNIPKSEIRENLNTRKIYSVLCVV